MSKIGIKMQKLSKFCSRFFKTSKKWKIGPKPCSFGHPGYKKLPNHRKTVKEIQKKWYKQEIHAGKPTKFLVKFP